MNMPMQQQYSPIGEVNSGDQSFGARRPYLLDGDYNLEVDRCVQRGRGQDSNFVIEATVLESNVPERPAGTQVVIFIDLTNTDTRGKHLAAFISSVCGYDPMTLPKNSNVTPWDGQQWSGYVVWAMSEQNPFAKRKFFCNVQTIFKKDNRGKFTLHTFSPHGLKQIGQRMLGPAFSAPDEQPQAPGAGFPGAAPGGGFQAPMPMPGMAPQGFQAAPQPGGGFPAPQMPQGAPPAGWGGPSPQPQGVPMQGAAPMPGYPQQPQMPMQPQMQPAYPQQPMQPQMQPAYPQQPMQPVYPQQPQQGYPQQPQQGYPQQPQQGGGFGGPWGGGQR